MEKGFSMAQVLKEALGDKRLDAYPVPAIIDDTPHDDFPVMLKAEILVTGKGCPVCGGEKTKRARTCLKCYEKIGLKATHSVNAVAEAISQSVEGHQAALESGNAVPREIIWPEKVLANVYVQTNAQEKVPGNGIEPYLDYQVISAQRSDGEAIPLNAFISVFVFGAKTEDAGHWITGIIERKSKRILVKNLDGKDMIVNMPYLRIQKVEDVESNMDLEIRPYQDNAGFINVLPTEDISVRFPYRKQPKKVERKGLTEGLLQLSVGFVKNHLSK